VTACAIVSAGKVDRLVGGVEQLRRDRVHPDPVRAQFDVEDAGQVDKSGLAHAVGRHAAGRLDPRAGGHVHDGT